MRTKFAVYSNGNVELSYDLEGCNGFYRTDSIFTCHINGGYVMEIYRDGGLRQVRERLGSNGEVLKCSNRGNLPGLIRREYRRMRRVERVVGK